MREATGEAGTGATTGAQPGPEWWERLGRRWRQWLAGVPHLARITHVVLALSVVLPLLAVAFVPGFRRGAHVWVPCFLMLNGWTVVAWTRTVRWVSVTRLYSLSVVWASAVLWISARVVAAAGLRPTAAGAAVVVAGLIEETFKLAPLAFLAAAAPGRVRRFNLADWAACGLATGLGFQTAEDFVRQASRRPNVLDLIFGGSSLRYGWTLFGGQFDLAGRAGFPGHHITTGLVALAVGLAAVATRRRWTAWPAVWLVPVAVWAVAVSDHMAFNAVNADVRYATARSSRLPGVVHLLWSATGRGYGLGWVLLVAVVSAVLADLLLIPRRSAATRPGLDLDRPEVRQQLLRPLHALQAARAGGLGPTAAGPGPSGAPPGQGRGSGQSPGFGSAQGQDSAGTALAAVRPALAAAYRVLAGLRAEREAAATTDSGPGRVRTRVSALVGGGAVAVLVLVVTVVLARHVGLLVGARPGSAWFLGLLDALARWWNDLPPGGKFLVIAGGIALLLAPELVIAELPLVLAGGGTASILITVPAGVTTAAGEILLGGAAVSAGASVLQSVADPGPGGSGSSGGSSGGEPSGAGAGNGAPASGPRAVSGEWTTGPKPDPPFQSEVDDLVGHAWEKHVQVQREFPEVGSQAELDEVVKDTIQHATEWGYRGDGSVYWYDDVTNTVVIKNPPGIGGTIYRPS